MYILVHLDQNLNLHHNLLLEIAGRNSVRCLQFYNTIDVFKELNRRDATGPFDATAKERVESKYLAATVKDIKYSWQMRGVQDIVV